MKIKNLVKLICLLLVVAFLATWAFGGMKIITTRFKQLDTVLRKGSDIGTELIAVYSIKAPEDAAAFDVSAAADRAADIMRDRLKAVGYEGFTVTRMDTDKVRLSLPETGTVSGLEDILENNGLLEVKNGENVIFTNKDVKSAKFIGFDYETQQYYTEITLTGEAKNTLKTLTSNGAYNFDVILDSDVVKATFQGSEVIRNGKMRIGFSSSSYSDALLLAYCTDSGNIEGTITAESNYTVLLQGKAGSNAVMCFAIAALVLFVLAAAYFVVAYRGMGLSAVLSSFIAILLLYFFTATFTWLQVDMSAVAGLGLAILLIVDMHLITLSNIKRQYAAGKSIADAIENGAANAGKTILMLSLVPVAAGLLLWLCGGDLVRNFGIALLGGGAIAVLTSALLLKALIKIFVGIGMENPKILGLKRGA